MLKERATLPFQVIKISCINTMYTMSCELREMESSSWKDMLQKDKKYTTSYFLFSSCFSAQQYCMVVFDMSKAIFSPS